jgi:hypothetical protein
MKTWTYKGVNVFPASVNASGIRWTARCNLGFALKADTKQGMKQLINEVQK